MNAAARRHVALPPRRMASNDPFVQRVRGERSTVRQAAEQIRLLRSTEFGRVLIGGGRIWPIIHQSVAHKLPA